MKYLKLILLLSSVIVIMGLLLTACDNRVTGPSDYTITSMTPDTYVIYADNNEATYATIKVMIKDSDDYAVADQVIKFSTDKGYLTSSEAITDSSGTATVKFHDGDDFGTAVIKATMEDVSESIEIEISNYTIAMMVADPYVIHSDGDESTYAIVQVLVKDNDNYGVAGQPVQFRTQIGYLAPGEAITDTSGVATVRFHDGYAFGTATIEAIIGNVTESIEINIAGVPPQDVSSIGFDVSEQVLLSVQGTGGTESFELIANLYDNSGQLIDQPKTVWFELLYAPDGTNINNIGLIDSTTSIAGRASVNINSGEHSGIVTCRVFTYNLENIEISAQKSNIVVASGTINTVEFSIGGHSTGVDMGSGIWRVQVSAVVNDIEGNPVAPGTAVFFSLPDNPQWASIIPQAYVNNENAMGDTVSGVAYTYLNYNGSYTNETIDVRIESGIGDIFEGELVLPIQFPVLDIAAVPLHIDWTEDNNPFDWRDHSAELSPYVELTVMDGQNNPIANQEVFFTSTCGTPVLETQFNMSPANPYFTPAYTGTTDENGRLIQYFRFYKYEVPEPIPDPPGTTTCSITALILGTNVSNQVTVILKRYVD